MSPYNSLSSLPLTSPAAITRDDPFFSPQREQNMNGAMMMGLPGMQSQFGNAPMDGFDFSDLGFNSPSGPGFEGQFNPFALAQAADDGSGSESLPEDDQTQFLHYILTRIANGQPEVQ